MTSDAVYNQKSLQQIINETSKKSSERNTGELGKDQFINLLVAQLKYQDPMNPVDDKEFIGQMAQFSALEQMQNMNSSMSQSQAYSLMGKRVTGSYVDEATKEIKYVDGDVTGVKVSQGKTYVVVRGKDIPIDRISEVAEGVRSQYSNISQYTNLIGFKANGNAYNPETGEIVPVSGNVKSIQKGLYEDYAVMDNVNVVIAEIVTETPSTDPDFIKEYLEDHEGEEVTVVIKDAETGEKVAVKATLQSADTDNPDGVITAVLDDVYVPVDSIENVTPAEQQKSEEEILLEKILEKLSDTDEEDDDAGSEP